jgi:cobalamin biosynthesis Mg chelatase CobN
VSSKTDRGIGEYLVWLGGLTPELAANKVGGSWGERGGGGSVCVWGGVWRGCVLVCVCVFGGVCVCV